MIFLFDTNDDASVQKLSDYLEHLNARDPDKKVTYTIEIIKNRPVRSVKQNRYYRAILKCIAGGECGYDEDQLHEMYKKKFNGEWVLDEQVGQSTGKMDTREFTIYVNKVKAHGREFFNAYIPEPEDDQYKVWEMTVKNNYDKMFTSL